MGAKCKQVVERSPCYISVAPMMDRLGSQLYELETCCLKRGPNEISTLRGVTKAEVSFAQEHRASQLDKFEMGLIAPGSGPVIKALSLELFGKAGESIGIADLKVLSEREE